MMRRYDTVKKFKNSLPPIILYNNNTNKNDHFVTEEDRKVKKITLSYYNKYIDTYTKKLKYPPNNYYSTDKINHSIPFKDLNDINLNKKLNFLSTFNVFDLDKKTSIFKSKIDINNESFNSNRLLSHSNFENKDLILYSPKFYKDKTDEEILKYFLEGTFLNKPEYLKYIGINEKNMYQHLFNDNDFAFFSNYLDSINKNENFTENKRKNYEYYDSVNHNKLNFDLDLKSICFQFEEININNISNNISKKEQMINDFINENKKEISKLYLPFKYLPLLFLFKYSSFKSFICDIISYDYQNDKFNFIRKGEFEEVIKKYSDKCKNKLKNYKKEKNSQILKSCIFYENEFHYNNEFFWLIYNDDKTDKRIFKLTIIFPLIEFKMNELNVGFKRFCNKWLLLEFIKQNFEFWDRYLLFTLFLNKFLRKTISDILNKKKGFNLLLNKTQFIGPVINSYYSKKNNFDFFLTEMNLGINYYYFIVPYYASISKKIRDKFEINDSVNLQLNNARKIYKLSEFFGLMGIFNKCMFYNKYKKMFYFSLKFLEDINDDYISFLKEQKHQFVVTNNDTKNIFIFNGYEYQLVIRDCLLCKRRVDIMNHNDYCYYKIPEKLYNFILGDNINKEKEVVLNLVNHANEIVNSNELDEKSINIDKAVSFKSFKTSKRNEAFSFKNPFSQFNNNKNKYSKIKSSNINEYSNLEKEDALGALYKKKINSYKNIRIFNTKYK